MSASVSGLNNVLASLTQAIGAVSTEAMKITEDSANAIGDNADPNVPVDTGGLLASKVVEEFTDGSTKGWQVSYGGGLPDDRAWYNELGTVKMRATPYLFPAYEGETPNWQAKITAL